MIEKHGKKMVTDTERVLVGVNKAGTVFYVWHKCRGKGQQNSPLKCSYNQLADTIVMLQKEAGKIVEE